MSGPFSTYDMVVFTAPSGAGKTTIVQHLLNKYSRFFSFSVSATTREKRKNETDGVDYYFMDIKRFKERVANGEFAEWEEVYEDKYYGTLNSEIDRIISSDKKVIFDIEVNGAQSLKNAFGERCLVVFVKPPSFRTLVQRLINRRSESPDSLRKRIKRIKKELLFEQSFDLVLLNDELQTTLEEAEKIIETHVLNIS
jgi:guanylate kinase